ncbi:MAG: FtsX-like permease family protein [Acidobacteriota bacterium]|nr:FtsX-like permease family protein [Acidobacteriota bacterium]
MNWILLRVWTRSMVRRRLRNLPVGVTVALGAFVLVVNGSIVAGIDRQLRETLVVARYGDLRLTPLGKNAAGSRGSGTALIDNPQRVESVIRRVLPRAIVAGEMSGLGMIQSDVVSSARVVFWGVDTMHDVPLLEAIAQRVQGQRRRELGNGRLWIGAALARRLDVERGDEVTVVLPANGSDINAEDFVVETVLEPGAPWEDYFAYMSLADYQDLAMSRGVNAFKVFLPDKDRDLEVVASVVSAAIAEEGKALLVKTCWESGRFYIGIVNANRLQLILMNLILLIAIGLGLGSIQLLAVYERRKEIGSMLALGASRRLIHLLFLGEGALLALVFGAMGAIAGIVSVLWLGRWGIEVRLEAVTWMIGARRIVPVVDWVQFLLAPWFLAAAVSVAGWWPAARAARMDPVAAMRGRLHG